jgi:hypothetical protein
MPLPNPIRFIKRAWPLLAVAISQAMGKTTVLPADTGCYKVHGDTTNNSGMSRLDCGVGGYKALTSMLVCTARPEEGWSNRIMIDLTDPDVQVVPEGIKVSRAGSGDLTITSMKDGSVLYNKRTRENPDGSFFAPTTICGPIYAAITTSPASRERRKLEL